MQNRLLFNKIMICLAFLKEKVINILQFRKKYLFLQSQTQNKNNNENTLSNEKDIPTFC